MTGELTRTTSKEKIALARHLIKSFDHLNAQPVDQLLKSVVAIPQFCSTHYTSLQAKNSTRCASTINPETTDNLTIMSHNMLPQINTYPLVENKTELEHKGGQK